MVFNNRGEVEQFRQSLNYLNQGSQGVCYKLDKMVYKFYHDYWEVDDDYASFDKEKILAFRHIKSSTFVFPQDVMMLEGKVIGDITVYKRAKSLSEINPLNVNLERFIRLVKKAQEDIYDITSKKVKCYDVMYNILLGSRLYIIDTLEYSFSKLDYEEVLKNNLNGFNLEIIYFLVDGLFKDVVNSYPKLKDMYEARRSVLFIEELQKYLEKLLGKKIVYLREAIELRDKKESLQTEKYERNALVRERLKA